jgi:hypothetical protein
MLYSAPISGLSSKKRWLLTADHERCMCEDGDYHFIVVHFLGVVYGEPMSNT